MMSSSKQQSTPGGLRLVSKSEREAILNKFKELDEDGQGFVRKSKLLTSLSPTMQVCPLVEDLLDVVIRRRMRADGTVMLKSKKARQVAKRSVYPADMVVFCSLFSAKEDESRRLVALFEVFDTDADGYATETDVARVFRRLYGTYFSNDQLVALTHSLFVQADVDADGELSFREFVRMASLTDLLRGLSRLL